jgi:DNA-binding NarL/FixJ family response regulator
MAVIWLIEDNVAFRNAIRFALESKPDRYQCHTFGSCELALAAKAKVPVPEVILLDVGLPGMDGIEGVQHFKAAFPEVSLLILTVFEDDEKVFRAICAGATGYLLKSEPIKNIILSIDQAVEGGAPINPRIALRVLSMFSKMAPVKKDYGLTEREQKVLELLVEGLAKKQIADRLDRSRHTVDYFVRCVYRKLHVNCQASAITIAMRDGLVDHSK